jgi:nitric oxide reductase subunit B
MAISLIPAGFYQFAIAIKHGIWYARSPAVTGSDFIHTVTWLRVIPDLVFDLGAAALIGFLVRAIAVDLKLRRADRGSAAVEKQPARRAA